MQIFFPCFAVSLLVPKPRLTHGFVGFLCFPLSESCYKLHSHVFNTLCLWVNEFDYPFGGLQDKLAIIKGKKDLASAKDHGIGRSQNSSPGTDPSNVHGSGGEMFETPGEGEGEEAQEGSDPTPHPKEEGSQVGSEGSGAKRGGGLDGVVGNGDVVIRVEETAG